MYGGTYSYHDAYFGNNIEEKLIEIFSYKLDTSTAKKNIRYDPEYHFILMKCNLLNFLNSTLSVNKENVETIENNIFRLHDVRSNIKELENIKNNLQSSLDKCNNGISDFENIKKSDEYIAFIECPEYIKNAEKTALPFVKKMCNSHYEKVIEKKYGKNNPESHNKFAELQKEMQNYVQIMNEKYYELNNFKESILKSKIKNDYEFYIAQNLDNYNNYGWNNKEKIFDYILKFYFLPFKDIINYILVDGQNYSWWDNKSYGEKNLGYVRKDLNAVYFINEYIKYNGPNALDPNKKHIVLFFKHSIEKNENNVSITAYDIYICITIEIMCNVYYRDNEKKCYVVENSRCSETPNIKRETDDHVLILFHHFFNENKIKHKIYSRDYYSWYVKKNEVNAIRNIRTKIEKK